MLTRLLRSEDGAGFIEFAIVLPVLVLLLIGIIETGRYMAFAVRLGNAAHAGAQFAAQGVTYSNNASAIADAACNDSGFSCSTATPAPGHTASPETMYISSTPSCNPATSPCPAGNRYIQVSASGTFRPLLRYPILGDSFTIAVHANQQVNP